MIPWKICALSPERMDATWSGSAAGRASAQQAGQAGEDRRGQQDGHGRSRAVRTKQVGQQALDRLVAHRAMHGCAVLSRREPHHPATRALWWYNPKMTTKKLLEQYYEAHLQQEAGCGLRLPHRHLHQQRWAKAGETCTR